MERVEKSDSAFRNPWVWGMAGLGAVVFSVNGLLLYFSILSSPGLVVRDFYNRGSQYATRSLHREAVERKWEWDVECVWPAVLTTGTPAPIGARIVSRKNPGVHPDRVELLLFRPSDARQDFSMAMEEDGEGNYRGEIRFPKKGVWDSILEIENSDGKYQVARRVTVSER